MIGSLQLVTVEGTEHCEDIHSLWGEGPTAMVRLNTWTGQGQLDCDCPEDLEGAAPGVENLKRVWSTWPPAMVSGLQASSLSLTSSVSSVPASAALICGHSASIQAVFPVQAEQQGLVKRPASILLLIVQRTSY